MKLRFSPRAIETLKGMHPRVRRALYKQTGFLLENLHHASRRAMKYDAARNLWQARVNRDWRFYFMISGDTFNIEDVIPLPK